MLWIFKCWCHQAKLAALSLDILGCLTHINWCNPLDYSSSTFSSPAQLLDTYNDTICSFLLSACFPSSQLRLKGILRISSFRIWQIKIKSNDCLCKWIESRTHELCMRCKSKRDDFVLMEICERSNPAHKIKMCDTAKIPPLKCGNEKSCAHTIRMCGSHQKSEPFRHK